MSEQTIDWTKPVYRLGDEKFECPGEVLCTNHAGEYPVAVWWPGSPAPTSYTLDGRTYTYHITVAVRNKPEEKPPVVQPAPEPEPAPAKEPAIDWTKPVYQDNDEAFEYPGEVLCTTHAGKYPVAVWWPGANSPDSYTLDGRHHAYDGYPSVCNKPEEKPPVVTHERWVNLYPNGVCTQCSTKALADEWAATNRVECHRIVWNSDGSPVVEKGMKIGWVNVYQRRDDWSIETGGQVYDTEDAAARFMRNHDRLYLGASKITYPYLDYKDGQGEGV